VTKDEVNRTIHEAMGLCIHKNIIHVGKGRMACKDCINIGRTLHVPDYHTPEGFFACWNWAKQQEWWGKFLDYAIENSYSEYNEDVYCVVALINSATFAPILAEWLKEARV